MLISAMLSLADNLTQASEPADSPSEWIEKNFLVYDPRDPVTGEDLSAGPIRLASHQKRIIDAALARNPDGTFKYTTIVYSAPKKSGKSALSSAVALWMATQRENSFVACLANDGKQANDRLFGPIATCIRLHRQMGGIFAGIRPKIGEVTLENFTKIEAVPCDAAGEAGSQPLATFWSELWGFKTPAKKQLFVEMTVPPTLYGHAIRWIETYAGHVGDSELLEQIYESGFINGSPHPDFMDLVGKDGPVVCENVAAGMFVYWDTEPRMPWQTDEYYKREMAMHPPAEFNRIHRNQWVSPANSFIECEWWDACRDNSLPELVSKKTPVVVGIDMAVTGDCAALVAVTRSPMDAIGSIAVRGVKIFKPSQVGGEIDQERLIRPVIEDWFNRWNVICWVYDPREMAKLAQDMNRAGFGWFKPFSQTTLRAIADKQLHDMIMQRQIVWGSNTEGDVNKPVGKEETLYKHITQAGAVTSGDSFRLEKLSNSAHIDAAVALSQATYTAMKLAINNRESDVDELIRLLQRREISLDEFSKRVQALHPKLKESKELYA